MRKTFSLENSRAFKILLESGGRRRCEGVFFPALREETARDSAGGGGDKIEESLLRRHFSPHERVMVYTCVCIVPRSETLLVPFINVNPARPSCLSFVVAEVDKSKYAFDGCQT